MTYCVQNGDESCPTIKDVVRVKCLMLELELEMVNGSKGLHCVKFVQGKASFEHGLVMRQGYQY